MRLTSRRLPRFIRASAPQRDLVPLIVDSEPRTGSTLLMQLLGSSDQVAFEREYPFEHRYLRWLMAWSRLPDGGHWDDSLWDQGTVYAAVVGRGHHHHGLVGPPPWAKLDVLRGSGDDDEPLGRALFQSAWHEFSKRAAEQTKADLGTVDGPVLYYAEKFGNSWTTEIGELLPARTISLIRDPRDAWLSILAFDRKRGYAGFGRREGETETEYLERFLDDQVERISWAVGVPESERSTSVRYERLAADLPGEAARLGRWLGVELVAGTVTGSRGEFTHHMTTGGGDESIGRWRREMDEPTRMRFRERVGVQLEQLGYEV